MSEHTKEPWLAEADPEAPQGEWVVKWSCEPTIIAFCANSVTGLKTKDSEANARRIVACVNSLAGVPTVCLEAGCVARLVALVRDVVEHRQPTFDDLRAALAPFAVPVRPSGLDLVAEADESLDPKGGQP